MEELKACPFCGGVAKRMEDPFVLPTNKIIYCENCKIRTSPCTTWEKAEGAWNRRAAPENNALTVEQLQEMGADMKNRPWVWIEVLKPFICESKISSYYQAQRDCTDGKAFRCGYRGMEYGFNYSDYGKTWLAYARKPEESNPLMNELREKLNQLEAEVTAESGDAAETYTNGYIWGHRNGQIELLRRILKTDEGGTIKLEGSEKP